MLKYSVTAVVLAAALLPALAQQSPQPTAAAGAGNAAASRNAGFLQSQSADEWRGSRLIGATVYDADNNSVGEVDDLVIGRDGNVRAVVVGVGEKNVALPFASLTIKRMQGSNAIDKIVVSYSKQQLKDAPRFAFDLAGERQTTGSETGGEPAAPTNGNNATQK